ncbi:unnamed protein product [Malus baccata var. baccata]
MVVTTEETWEVLGDVYCSTRLLGVSEIPKMEDDLKSKLWLDVKANVTVMVLPRILEDGEDLENHYKDKLEIDLDKTAMSPAASKAVSRVLSGLINVPLRTLLSVADTIVREALRARARGTSLVHMEALIKVEVVEESDDDGVNVEPAFVPATKSSIDMLERVRVEASLGFCCSICISEIGAGTEGLRMPCLHLYHENCIVEWLETSRFCPLCRNLMYSFVNLCYKIFSPIVSLVQLSIG